MQWWHIFLIIFGSITLLFFLTILFYKPFFKRFWDIALSLIGLLILWFPMLVIGIIIKIDSKGPMIFKQKRLGKNKKQFTVLKFRTMCNHAYEHGGIAKNENDSRITKIGKFLRKTSIDELPQLINIFLGQMSIIGPRPVLDWEYEEFSREEFEPRFKARPGMFCTVDVKYRASASRELQFQMDADYADNIKVGTDAKTFLGIIKTIFSGKNIYVEENNKNE